ncbi:hypothetical protein OOK31_01685 [Streptomyces sp. NBC_00249]|uniref:hypothetical protein n=1 Tax=Streptomyces sp. NBC_00249 TaxID=2975690 RepID=UPI00224E1F5F|nr:hypothetical protein [Streptomyces sp. NBC_00249]MCX5192612.1 hypothetical protein [Streptomyces sp. NBC_00249]
MHVRPRLRPVPLAAALVLTAALSACAAKPGTPAEPPAPSAAPTPAGSPSAAASPGTPPGASPSASASPAVEPTPPPTTAPPAPATRLTMTVATVTGRLSLVRGGPAQEFTVTLRNGNSRPYEHLLLAFQMEPLLPEPGDTPGPAASVLLERQDPATGRWSPAALRVAGDLKPYSLYEGGPALARDAVRTERYRLRATATGPTGSSPLEVRAVDTDAPEGAPEERARPGYMSLPHSVRRAS